MKKLILLACSIGISATLSHAQLIDLVSLGSADFTIESTVSIGTYTQDATGVRFSPSVSLGDTVGGFFTAAPLNWSSYADLNNNIYLKISFTGANPLLPMTLQLFEPTLTDLVTYQGTTTPLADPAFTNYYKFTISSGSPANVLSKVAGAQITWDGGGNVNANLEKLATVPEPSTYALLAMSGLGVAGYVVRRRRRA